MNKRPFFIAFVASFIFSCGTYQIQKSEGISVSVSDQNSTNSELTEVVAPYKKSLDSTMNEVIAVSEMEMSTGSPQGLLGNWVCDLSLEIGNLGYTELTTSQADFCVLNNGGLRTFLPEGDITKRKIFEIMPFENELVVVTLSAQKTKELFEYIAKKTIQNGTRKDGVPVSGNVRVVVKNQLPAEVIIDSVPLRNRTYRVMTTDYLAHGGDNMSFFLNPINYESWGVKLRDAILYYAELQTLSGKKLTSTIDKRIAYDN